MNETLIRRVYEHIAENPERWDQHAYVAGCGSTLCFAGWTLILSGHELFDCPNGGWELDGETLFEGSRIAETAARELGLDRTVANDLFLGKGMELETVEQLATYLDDHFGVVV